MQWDYKTHFFSLPQLITNVKLKKKRLVLQTNYACSLQQRYLLCYALEHGLCCRYVLNERNNYLAIT